MEKLNNWVSIVICLVNNAILCVKKTFKAMVCQMYGTYSKTKCKIMKHHQKDHIIFFIPNCRSWDFKQLLEKAKPTSVDSSPDKAKALIGNVASKPLDPPPKKRLDPQHFFLTRPPKKWTKKKSFFFTFLSILVLVLLSALVKIFSVSRMQDFLSW